MSEPEEKLIKIIESIKRMKEISASEVRTLTRSKSPILLSFINELNNYSESRVKNQ